MIRIFFCIGLFLLAGCAGYRKLPFTYEEGGSTRTITHLVPSGFKKVTDERDSSGNVVRVYHYGKTSYYIAHQRGDSLEVQPIIPSLNVPRVYQPNGAIMFKGLNPDDTYWRETRRSNLRFGYRFVEEDDQVRFDSASNYTMVLPLK